MRFAIYTRISRDREGAGLGVERQLEDCQALVKRMGGETFLTLTDNDLSGMGHKHRPGYESLLDAMRSGQIEAVAVWHGDRLTRSMIELETYAEASETHNVATYTVRAGAIDLSTPSGRLVARQLGAVARYEVEHSIERQKAAAVDFAHISAWQTFADLLDPPENPYAPDPVGWVRDRLGEFLWSKQREILEAVVRHRYVAVKSAHDTGKSHGASRAVAWWLDTREDPFATTAPTTKQVHAILWRYIGQAHRKGNLPGRITLDDEWYMGPGGKELVAFGRKPADHDQSAFQGIHALNPLILVDEACGVPKSIFDAVDALATNSNARVLAIGNPDDPSSHFAQICKPGSGWHVITVSAFDTPAYTGEEVPEELLPLLVSPEWVEERKLRWGVTSPIYQSKVLGEFPDISDDTLILPNWIEAAQKRKLERTRRPIIAADIARFGEDETVIMRREGGWIRVYRAHHKADTMTTAGHIAKAMRNIDDEVGKNDWVRAIIDVPGVGGGVVDRLAELELPVVPYNGGEAPIDKERFVNARAEDYWTLRERFEQGEIDIDPDDDKLAAQLGSIKWGIDSRGRIKIESKDDIRKRGLPSPDRADALAIAFAGRANAAPMNVESHAGGSITGDLMTKAW